MKKPRAKAVSEPGPDDILSEYDFSNGLRNKYAPRYGQGAVAVILDADVAEHFPTARAVNDALRSLAVRSRPGRTKRRPKRRSA